MSSTKANVNKHVTITIKLDYEAEQVLENRKAKLSDILEGWCQKQYAINIVPRGKVSKRTSTTVSVNCLNILKQKANELGISVNTLINSIIKGLRDESDNS